MRTPGLIRYRLAAHWYDVLSLEWPVYRIGRIAGIGALGLRPGDRVLDIGCGTGLNLPLLRKAVGASGEVVGVDASEAMLARASARIVRHGWLNVSVRAADAAALVHALGRSKAYDAVLFTYSLSIITGWKTAWEQALTLLRPGARIGVVDLAMPTGWGRLWSPLSWLACVAGGVDSHREPWLRVSADTRQVFAQSLRAGHIRVAVGVKTTMVRDARPVSDGESRADGESGTDVRD